MAGTLRSRVVFIPALVLSVAPKCPLCLVAYGGLLGLASLPASAYGLYLAWLSPAICAALSLWVLAVFWQGRGERLAWPALLACFAAALVAAGRFWLHEDLLVGLGLALLLCATFGPKRRAADCSCGGT